jgi:hypothetical protein
LVLDSNGAELLRGQRGAIALCSTARATKAAPHGAAGRFGKVDLSLAESARSVPKLFRRPMHEVMPPMSDRLPPEE